MRMLIKRFAALFAAGCIFMMNGLMLTVSAESKESSGYWKLDPSKTIVWLLDEEARNGAVISGGRGTYNYSHTRTDGTWQAIHSGDTETSCNGEYVNIVMKCDEPPDIIYPYQEVQLRFEVSFSASQYMDSVCDALKFSVDYSFNEYPGESGTYSTWFADKNGNCQLGLDRIWDFPDGYGATGPGNYLFYVDSDNVLRHTFETEGGKLWIRHYFDCYIQTAYFYDWVDTTESAAAGTESEEDSSDRSDSSSEDESLWIIQNESKNALDSSGEDSGTEINPAIITGKKEDDDRPSTAAEKAIAAAGSAGVATAAALAAANDRKKKKISYKMLISKDFGDTVDLYGHYTVYARIVQIHSGADLTRNADEYTRMIKVSSPHTKVNYFYHTPSGRIAAEFDVNEDNTDTLVLSFTFTGKGGVFTESVTFKVKSTKKSINLLYINSDGSIGEIFEPDDDIRPHGLFLGENTFSTLFIYAVGFNDYPKLTCECDSFMLKPTAVPLPRDFNSSPNIIGFLENNYAHYNDMANAKYFKVDLNNKTQKSSSLFGKYPLNTNVTFTAKSERGAEISRILPVFIVPKGFYIDIEAFDERQKSREYIELYTNELVDVNRSQLRSTRIPVNIGFAYYGRYRQVSGNHPNNRFIPVERVTYDGALCRDVYTPVSASASNIKLKKEFFFTTNYLDYSDVYKSKRYALGWHRDEGHTHNAVMEFCPKMPVLVNNNKDELLFELEVYYKAMNNETQALMNRNDIPLTGKIPVRIYGEPADSALHARHEELRKLDRIIKIMQLEGTEPVKMLSNNCQIIPTDDICFTRRWIFEFGQEYQSFIFKEYMYESAEYSEIIAYLSTVEMAASYIFTQTLRVYCATTGQISKFDLYDTAFSALIEYLKGYLGDLSLWYYWNEKYPNAADMDRLTKLFDDMVGNMIMNTAESEANWKKLVSLVMLAGFINFIKNYQKQLSEDRANGTPSKNFVRRIVTGVFKDMSLKIFKMMIGKALNKYLDPQDPYYKHEKVKMFDKEIQEALRFEKYFRNPHFSSGQIDFFKTFPDVAEKYGEMLPDIANDHFVVIDIPNKGKARVPFSIAIQIYIDRFLTRWGIEKVKSLFDTKVPESPVKGSYVSAEETRKILKRFGKDTSKLDWK